MLLQKCTLIYTEYKFQAQDQCMWFGFIWTCPGGTEVNFLFYKSWVFSWQAECKINLSRRMLRDGVSLVILSLIFKFWPLYFMRWQPWLSTAAECSPHPLTNQVGLYVRILWSGEATGTWGCSCAEGSWGKWRLLLRGQLLLKRAIVLGESYMKIQSAWRR